MSKFGICCLHQFLLSVQHLSAFPRRSVGTRTLAITAKFTKCYHIFSRPPRPNGHPSKGGELSSTQAESPARNTRYHPLHRSLGVRLSILPKGIEGVDIGKSTGYNNICMYAMAIGNFAIEGEPHAHIAHC